MKLYKTIHGCTWESTHNITSFFTLEKQQRIFHKIVDKNAFDLIYSMLLDHVFNQNHGQNPCSKSCLKP